MYRIFELLNVAVTGLAIFVEALYDLGLSPLSSYCSACEWRCAVETATRVTLRPQFVDIIPLSAPLEHSPRVLSVP